MTQSKEEKKSQKRAGYVEVDDNVFWSEVHAKNVGLINKIYSDIKPFIPGYSLHFMPDYVGFTKDGKTKNIMVFRSLIGSLSIEVRLECPDYDPMSLNKKGMEVVKLCRHWYSIRVKSYDEYKQNKSVIDDLIIKSEKERSSPKRVSKNKK